MVLSTLITGLDTKETIRDNLGAILHLEQLNQQVLATAASLDPDDWKLRIFVEAYNPWEQYNDAPTDVSPLVNIWFDSSVTDKKKSNWSQRQGEDGTFWVDVYGYGVSEETPTGHVSGDQAAAIEAARATRLVRRIIMAGEYSNIGITENGIIGLRYISSQSVFQPERALNTVGKVVATRLNLSVSYNEFSPEYQPETLESVFTEVLRSETGEIYLEADFDYS